MLRRCCLPVLIVLLAALTVGRVSRGEEGSFPRPSHDAIAKAEEKVKDVYKADLAKAAKPSEKAALAAVLLKAADGAGSDDASRLVLLTMARDVAIDANDARLAMKAVAALVRRFQPDGPTDAKEQIERGNSPWKEAETAPAENRLRLQIQAAEWYLRAKPAATGVDETLIAKRLAELGGAKPSDGLKTFAVTYIAGRDKITYTDEIRASSAEDAKQDVIKRHRFAKFKKIEEKK